MKKLSIALLPGDGIGMEVVPAARKVLEKSAGMAGIHLSFEEFAWGSDHYFRLGQMMPMDALEQLRAHDAILLGAVGHPDIPDHITLNGMLLPIRRAFDLYVNERPAFLYEGVASPLRGYDPGSIDMVVVRENTEGEYANVGGFVYHHLPEEVAIQTSVFTRHGCERIIRYAFDLARRRNRKRKVASITKSNAQGYGMVLWDRIFREVSAEYPDIETESLLVDAAAMNFVRRPASFDVVVGSNLFGDILSDLSAIVTGSIGLAPSANLDPRRLAPSLFEPVHGSAPDIAGRGVSNPLATILAAAMMMEHLGEPGIAASMEGAVRAVLAEGRQLTADLGGKSTTAEVTGAVLDHLA
ncbi:tartrate dehydrogenase [uncultured Paludibaculum sp.]|uniref:tartrate dehydrogenase n=1 Tax=uncultured Paludibaculum sp. TaxID=1765020 RepID=UPI002AAB37A8|nr:tartrate dehydrogenase [uncultured Paludibaculum sp.]